MAKYSNSELCLIWLDSFLGLEYKHKKELYKLINGKEGIKELLSRGKDYIVNCVGDSEYTNIVGSANPEYLSFILDGLETRGITAVTINSPDYPKLLSETPFSPLVLYAKGDISLLNSKCFGIVGSRKSLPISIKIAEDFSKNLAEAGFTLVTGIAQGIDETVIKSALAVNAKVISVLGGGMDNIYPSSNKDLVNKVCEDGLVITEYPPEIASVAYHFPIRNRIIAGLSCGVLIVSGATKSGTQYTANYAIEYGRDLFAIPYGVGVPSGAGCNDLIKRGALLCDCPQDILEFYGLDKKQEQQNKLAFSADELEIIKALADGEQHIQKICQLINKPIFEVLPVLSELEIKGIVNKNGVNVYGLVRSVLEE